MDRIVPSNLNRFLLGNKSFISRKPNARFDSHFAAVTPIFRDIESFLVNQIRKYPAVVGSVYTIGNEPIAKAMSDCEKAFLITQNANFKPGYLDRNKWEKQLGWKCYPFQTSIESIFSNTKDRWFAEAGFSLLEEILKDFEEPELDVEASGERKEQILKIINYYGALNALSSIENSSQQTSAKSTSFADIAKFQRLNTPYWIPGTKVLVYSNEGMSSSSVSTALMHHKFLVFLDKVEKLFQPKRNPEKCWKCDQPLEVPTLGFWNDLYDELVSNGEEPETARAMSQEWEIQCPCSKCDAHNIFYNPKTVNHYDDWFPQCKPRYKPVAVWTGSFNFTYSAANKHLENGVFIESSDVANIYFQEWAINFVISEKFRL